MNWVVQNRDIDELINHRRTHPKDKDYALIQYRPYNIDIGTVYTNIILQKVLGDACFSWSDAKQYRNSFGKAQYFANHKFSFQKILQVSDYIIPEEKYKYIDFNAFPKERYVYKNTAFTNLWVGIDNPDNVTLHELVDTIEFESGGIRYQKYATSNIEHEINVLAYIFQVDGIKYENKRIYVPLIVPYNVFILHNIHHPARIRVIKNSEQVFCEVYGNVCDSNALTPLAHTNNMTHQFASVFYRTQFTGSNTISMTKQIIRLFFLHPTYALYIMNISQSCVKSRRLFLDNYTNTQPHVHYEYPLHDIDWFDNHAIIWLNRTFLMFDELNKNVNFSCIVRGGYLEVENTYSEPQSIDIVAVSFDMIYNRNGMAGLLICFLEVVMPYIPTRKSLTSILVWDPTRKSLTSILGNVSRF